MHLLYLLVSIMYLCLSLIWQMWQYRNSLVSLQLELNTGHRGVHPQGTVSTQALSPTLRCCEEGMEGMGEMECLVPMGLKDRGESKELQVPVGLKDRRESKE